MNTGGPGTQLIDGRFELLERLGGGGMGLVWRARDTALHREVALKEVRPPDPALFDGDPRAAQVLRERVLREARSLARLNHPHVVTIHHIVDRPEYPHPWLVMELVTGGSLHDRLVRGPMSPGEAATLGRGVLAALSAAHAAGIQHRDVKPGNVLLRPDGSPVLTDFGIAALRESTSLTTTGSLIGSPEFIAPERIRGEEGNPSSDLWSLGMMLYVAVEGHHPLRRSTSLATLAAVLDEELPPPVRSGPLAPVLTALLARNAAVRPDAAQLDRLLAEAEHNPTGTVRLNAPVAYTPTRTDGVRPTLPADLPPPADAPSPTPAPPAAVRTRAGRSQIYGSYIAAVVMIGVVLWTANYGFKDSSSNGASSQSSGSAGSQVGTSTGARSGAPTDTQTGTQTAAGPDLLTTDGVRGMVQAMSPVMGGTQVKDFTVYPDYGFASAPTTANPRLVDRWEYRNGKTTRSVAGGGTLGSDDKTVDLKSVDWTVLPTLLQRADAELGIAQPTTHYIVVEYDVFMEEPAVLVYVADSYGGAYLAADFKGQVKRKVPRAG